MFSKFIDAAERSCLLKWLAIYFYFVAMAVSARVSQLMNRTMKSVGHEFIDDGGI